MQQGILPPARLVLVMLLSVLAMSCQQPPRTDTATAHALAALYAVERLTARAEADSLPLIEEPTAAPTATATVPAAPPEPAAGNQPTVATPAVGQAPVSDLWQQFRDGFALDHHLDHPAVQAELRWFKRHPNYFRLRSQAFATYMPYVLQEVQAYGIPTELALMPVIESALDPYAFSPGGAAGLWQFIDATAQRFGLRKTWWYDGRRDVIAATDAAMSYLSFLHQSFDDWLLVMAGYNAGEGSVRRALRRYKAQNAATEPGFFDLRLPGETRQYVPRILAYAAVIADPEKYGVGLPELPLQPGFRTVTLPAQFDLMKVSELLQMPLEDLYRWNPALNQWATPAKGPHRLIVPPELDVVQAESRFAGIAEKERMGWKIITVRAGDSLSTIAARNGIRSADIRKINRLRSDLIRAGQQLYIPKSKEAAAQYPIARLHGDRTHTVRPGDSLWKLARANGVTIKQLVRWNELNPKAPLRVGQTLHVGRTSRSVMRKVRYRVRSGDNLSRIASRFNVRSADIASWNGLDISDYLQPGQRLTLHVNVAKGLPAET
ncbi:MAG: LysM peptidoglycan-binding domain-containing protein [Pseudomonadota bacterium]